MFINSKGEWDRNLSFVRIRFRRPTSTQLSKAVKADEISAVEPTQPLRLARQSKNKKRLGLLSQSLSLIYLRFVFRLVSAILFFS